MSSPRARGFTLLELVLLITVIAVGLAGILTVYMTSLKGSADPSAVKQGLVVAEAMLEEIQLTAFCNPAGGFSGAATQANRQNFDDVADYNTFATTGAYTIDGVAPITGLEFYNVSVGVANAAFSTIAAGDSLQITVTVTGPTDRANSATLVLTGYRFDYPGSCP